jgi:signal transduction histidine kinase/CheY-like chemotaxis protein
MGADAALRSRVLLYLATTRDADLAADVLDRHGMGSARCRDAASLLWEIERGAGALLVAEEMLADGAGPILREMLARQPRWSDLPVLLLTRAGANSDAVLDAIAYLGNVTLMERPLRVAALVSTVRAALRARARQYQIESHLAELERARAAESDNAKRKDEFLAMLAHELRNPLAPIGNALQVLELSDADPQRRRQLRRMMQRQVEHLVRLVDDLLEASRLSQGKIQLERDVHDLRAILAEGIDQGRLDQAPGSARIVAALPSDPMPVLADPVRLGQVFANLLNNARKYGSENGTIVVEAAIDGDWAVVRVKDDGIGIPPELLPHVFELFTQGRREVHRLHDGLGIGLALVQGLVEMHGGRVEAHSAGRGQGSEFVVRLPLAPEGVQAGDRPRAEVPGPRKLRILVVDDNEDAALSLSLLLRAMGHELRVAHGGEEGLEAAADFRPDVALLDIGMPGMDGYALARRLRSDPSHAGMLIAAVTGWGQARDRSLAEAAGFDLHFRKPISGADLAKVLQAAPAA